MSNSLEDLFGVSIEHCGSCHSEIEDGYSDIDPIVIVINDEEVISYSCCCGTREYLEATQADWWYA